MEPVIKVENLAKRYQLRTEGAAYTTLRDSLSGMFRSRGKKEDFWALNNVSFDINPGERVGIIGRNGAGKSTLLKVLSRIVTPTKGRITIEGRVASLLEVGTGFHPELSGRENIFLNGAILGMSKAEIKSKFDEIVAFAEVERFLDTPVKRYSSGMYIRLAFAVAAHLEPEILIVDEVLAVGDAAFQKKCLGKMRDVAGHGRTILFVSHNMAAVQNLCNKCIYLKNGELVMKGNTEEVIPVYLRATAEAKLMDLSARTDRSGNGALRFMSFTLLDNSGKTLSAAQCGDAVTMRIEIDTAGKTLNNLHVAVGIDDEFGQRITHFSNEVTNQIFEQVLPAQKFIDISIAKLPLKSGEYTFTLYSTVQGEIADWLQEAGKFMVEAGDFFRTGRLPAESQGTFFIDHSFRLS